MDASGVTVFVVAVFFVVTVVEMTDVIVVNALAVTVNVIPVYLVYYKDHFSAIYREARGGISMLSGNSIERCLEI